MEMKNLFLRVFLILGIVFKSYGLNLINDSASSILELQPETADCRELRDFLDRLDELASKLCRSEQSSEKCEKIRNLILEVTLKLIDQCGSSLKPPFNLSRDMYECLEALKGFCEPFCDKYGGTDKYECYIQCIEKIVAFCVGRAFFGTRSDNMMEK